MTKAIIAGAFAVLALAGVARVDEIASGGIRLVCMSAEEANRQAPIVAAKYDGKVATYDEAVTAEWLKVFNGNEPKTDFKADTLLVVKTERGDVVTLMTKDQGCMLPRPVPPDVFNASIEDAKRAAGSGA